MIVAVSFMVFLLSLKGGFYILEGVFNSPSKNTIKGLRITRKKEGLQDKFLNGILKPLVIILAAHIKLNEDKEKLLNYELARAGISEDAKTYYSKAIVIASMYLMLPILTIFMGMYQISFLALFLVVIIFFQNISLHKKELKKKREAIEKNLPSFIRSILYKINDSSSGKDNENIVVKADLIRVFEDYLKVADPVFSWDISVLIMEMKTKDIEQALRNFNSRLAIPEVGFLCNALVGLVRGEPQNETLSALAREMDIKSKENIKRELEKMPGKVFRACIPLIAMGFIAIGYVMIVALVTGISGLK